jgi:hypothetical protein
MCGGGGGSAATTREIPDDLKPVWYGSIDRAVSESEKQFQPYAGGDPNARIAPMQWLHGKAAFNTEALADAIGSPAPAINAAQNQATNTLNGNYLSGAQSSPYTRPNQYQGMNNPYFNQVLQQQQDSIRSNYDNTTSPELTRLMNMSGALGSSAHVKAMSNNQANLAKQLADTDAGMRNTQYDRSGAMDEAALGRGMQAYEGERGRQMGAIQGGYGAQDSAFQRLQGLMGMGDMYRSYDQDVKNYQYQNYMDDQNENRYGLDFLTGVLSRAGGGFSNITQSMPQYQVSPYSALMSGLMAYGAMK